MRVILSKDEKAVLCRKCFLTRIETRRRFLPGLYFAVALSELHLHVSDHGRTQCDLFVVAVAIILCVLGVIVSVTVAMILPFVSAALVRMIIMQ